MIVKTSMATYLPRWLVGASSEVAARAVSSLTPAPIPANTIPQMKMFMECAVEQMIMPTTMQVAPISATHRRPMRSEMEPVNGHTAARLSKFAKTNQIQRSAPPTYRLLVCLSGDIRALQNSYQVPRKCMVARLEVVSRLSRCTDIMREPILTTKEIYWDLRSCPHWD